MAPMIKTSISSSFSSFASSPGCAIHNQSQIAIVLLLYPTLYACFMYDVANIAVKPGRMLHQALVITVTIMVYIKLKLLSKFAL